MRLVCARQNWFGAAKGKLLKAKINEMKKKRQVCEKPFQGWNPNNIFSVVETLRRKLSPRWWIEFPFAVEANDIRMSYECIFNDNAIIGMSHCRQRQRLREELQFVNSQDTRLLSHFLLSVIWFDIFLRDSRYVLQRRVGQLLLSCLSRRKVEREQCWQHKMWKTRSELCKFSQ